MIEVVVHDRVRCDDARLALERLAQNAVQALALLPRLATKRGVNRGRHVADRILDRPPRLAGSTRRTRATPCLRTHACSIGISCLRRATADGRLSPASLPA